MVRNQEPGPEESLDDRGVRQLRGVNGSEKWLVTNTRLDLAAETSLSQGATKDPKFKDITVANELVKTAQAHVDLPLWIHSIHLDRLTLVSFSDAALAVRPDGTSQGGQPHIWADKSTLDGHEIKFTIADWKSWRLKRVVRSSLSCEVQAFAEA